MQCSAVQYSILVCTTAHYCTLLYSSVVYSSVQCTVQYCSVWGLSLFQSVECGHWCFPLFIEMQHVLQKDGQC